MRIAKILLLIALMPLSAVEAAPKRVNQDTIVSVFSDKGYKVSWMTKSDGNNPALMPAMLYDLRTNDAVFSMDVMPCAGTNRCIQYIILQQMWDVKNTFTIKQVQEWQSRYPSTRIRLDDDDTLFLTYQLTAAPGGMTYQQLDKALLFWNKTRDDLDKFESPYDDPM